MKEERHPGAAILAMADVEHQDAEHSHVRHDAEETDHDNHAVGEVDERGELKALAPFLARNEPSPLANAQWIDAAPTQTSADGKAYFREDGLTFP